MHHLWYMNDCLHLYIECIQEGLWRHSTRRPFFCNFGPENEAKGRLSFGYPTGFLNSFNLYMIHAAGSEMSNICSVCLVIRIPQWGRMEMSDFSVACHL